ncbi:MAG: VWA domain-containing protein [Planctomycetes bacterium]|nr:VWA domain-containing protein [Planctomycetota bacterium]
MELMTLKPLWWIIALIGLVFVFRSSLVNRPAHLKFISFLLRIGAMVLLLLALCRPFLVSSSNSLHVVYILDASESVDLDSAIKATDDIAASIKELSLSDSYSLFLAGSRLRPFDNTEDMKELLTNWKNGISDSEFRSASPLPELMLSARFAFPANKARRMVLISDAVPTTGETAKALGILESEDVDLQFTKLKPLTVPEIAIAALTPSVSTAYKGQMVRLNTSVTSNTDSDAIVTLLHKGVIVQQKPVELIAGKTQNVSFDVRMQQNGSVFFTAQIVSEKDHFAVNNQASCTVTVKGQPRILILHQKPQEMRLFARALEQQDFEVDTRGKYGMPASMQALLAFDAVIIADVPATDFTVSQMHMLKSYVTDFGGGLAMFGSNNSYGLGGYYKTPVEQTLPLISRFEKEKEKPSLAMVIVIDKSGSMGGQKISLAKQAAKSAVELLSARDQIGIVAFDSRARVISEMRSASDKETIKGDIDTLAAGGGTCMYPGMNMAYEMLQQTTSKIKHVILLGDGRSQQADHQGLASEMSDFGITVSTVAMGAGADRALLSAIAEIGKGRYYETNDPENVPQIFTRETMQASKSAIKEDIYAPLIISDHPMFAGVAEDELPFCFGYVMAKPKPTAQVLLAAETGDPLLAISRFGLGIGMAYTSDVTEKWGGEWLAWDKCGSFWAQVFRSVVKRADTEGIYITSQAVGNKWVVDIKRQDPDSKPINAANLMLRSVDQNNSTQEISVEQIGLGIYRAIVPLEGVISASLSIQDVDYEKAAVIHYNRPYHAEYDLTCQPNERLVAQVNFVPSQIKENIQPIDNYSSAANPLTIAAMVMFIGSGLLRRI